MDIHFLSYMFNPSLLAFSYSNWPKWERQFSILASRNRKQVFFQQKWRKTKITSYNDSDRTYWLSTPVAFQFTMQFPLAPPQDRRLKVGYSPQKIKGLCVIQLVTCKCSCIRAHTKIQFRKLNTLIWKNWKMWIDAMLSCKAYQKTTNSQYWSYVYGMLIWPFVD